MSRIGRQPIPVPAGVTVAIEPETVRVNGPKGELSERISRDIEVVQEGEQLLVSRPTDRGEHRALHGLTRSLRGEHGPGRHRRLREALEIQGVGYRAQLKGKNLELAVGYSHPVPIPAPAGIEFEVPQPTRIVVKGISKQLVGETAAIIRKQRPPEPYKGKGIRYEGEYVARKVGKGRMTVITKGDRRLKRRRRVRAKISGTADASADLRVPLQQGPLRAADRRRRRRARSPRSTGTSPSCARSPKPSAPSAPGELLAERAKAAGVSEAVFDRGGYRYHGHVRAFAEAIRESGLTV